MTDLPPLPLRVGFDRARILRSAIVFLALATLGAILLAGLQHARPSMLGEWLGSRSLGPVPLIFVLVEGTALLVVGAALNAAWQRRDYLMLREDGIEFHNYHGIFHVAWGNIARLERAEGGFVGIQVRDLERLVATHEGSAEQRERLATLEPMSGYELILQPEQLPCGVDRFIQWVTELRQRAEGR